MSVRADMVRMGKLVDMQRPGIATAFMVPARLDNQVRNGPKTPIQFTPTSTADGIQWSVAVQRPGIAEPLITARAEQVSSDAIVRAMNNKEQAASVANIKTTVAQANANNSPGAGVAGYFAGWARRSR